MLKVGVQAGVAAAFALALGLCAPGSYAESQPFKVVSSQPYEKLTNLFASDRGWTGADAAYSVPLNEERTIWIFGDTFIGKNENGRRVDSTMITNSVGVQKLGKTLTRPSFYWNGTEKSPQAIFVSHDPKTWFWPGDGIAIKGKLYVFLHRMRRKPDVLNEWAFENAGDVLAQIDNPLQRPTDWRVKLQELPGTMRWGNAVVADGGFVYVYGEPTFATANSHPITVARIPSDKFERLQVAAWEYRCRAAAGSVEGVWAASTRDAQVLLVGGAPEMTVSHLRGMAGLFATYTLNGMKRDIVISHADRPEGPWSKPQIVYESPKELKGRFPYAAKAHPELASKDGELVITYCRNTGVEDNMLHADVYRPQGVRVMLKRY